MRLIFVFFCFQEGEEEEEEEEFDVAFTHKIQFYMGHPVFTFI